MAARRQWQNKIGVGLRSSHIPHILQHLPDVDFFEIISENYMVDGGLPLYNLDQICERYSVVQHGVALYPGSAQGIDREHLTRLKQLTKRTNTPWLTDHLCWGSVDGTMSHDLLPLPYTRAAIDVVSENLRIAQDYLETPLAVENVSSYVTFHESRMSEWEFVTEVVERADVGLLLDVNNIYVSAKNHGFDPYAYLAGLPHHRVQQIHLAGHAPGTDVIIDTHDHPVIDEVWGLYARALELCGQTATLLEWDADIPPFDQVHQEALKARQYWPAAQGVANAA